ncbi:MAG: dTDP-4-dehydrorhamnose 3,5-epimerase [Burkholderiaceae bacterium]
MKIIETDLPGVLIIEPRVFEDDRGFFLESFNQRKFEELTGVGAEFVQDNHSRSSQHVLRGLHYQVVHPQGKLVRVVHGEVLDIAVDMRKGSEHFGQHVAMKLSAENKHQAWVPPGFAHGFVVLSEHCEVLYKTTDYWHPEAERTLLWNDPALAIDWGVDAPVLSAKDAEGTSLIHADLYD